VQVDLFSAEGDLPQNLDQVMERHKDIMYASRTQVDAKHVRKTRRWRGALRRLLQKLPRYFKGDPDVRVLQAAEKRGQIDIVHLINPRHDYPGHAKDYEFSRAAIQELWAAGGNDVRRIVAHPERLRRTNLSDSMRVYQLPRTSQRKMMAAA
jgi:NTE family protein